MRGLRTTGVVLGLLALSCCDVAFASESSELQAGVQFYSQRNYEAAIKQLSHVVMLDTSNAEARYLLGCCYTQQNLAESASREYQNAIKLDPKGPVGTMARAALKNLTAVQQSQHATVATVGSVPPAPAPASALAPAPRNAVTDTLSLIQNQAKSEKQRHETSGNVAADDTARHASAQVEKLLNEKRSTINSMRSAMTRDSHGYSVPTYTEAQIQRAANDFDERTGMIQNQSKIDAQSQRDFAKAKMADLDQVAKNLASQLQSDGSGVKLLPSGTNLYVRSYVAGPSSPADSSAQNKPAIPEQLAASQDKLILEPVNRPGKMVSRVVPEPLSGSQDKMTVQPNGEKSSRRELNVHGRLTHI